MKFKRIYIEITNICNLNCSFCSPLKREKRFLSFDEFVHIINEIKPYKSHIYLHLKGEPLIHPEFEKIIKYAYFEGININITTNGTLIGKFANTLLKYARQVNISVHSLCDGQISDPDRYIQEICDFGKKAMTFKKPYVSYRMWNGSKDGTISPDALDILRRIGENFGEQIHSILKRGRDAVKLSENIFISFMDEFEWPSLKLCDNGEKGTCLGGREMIGILSDGTVVPCCLDADGIINLGNIFSSSIYDILKTERYLNLKKGFENKKIYEDLCKRCSYRLRFNI